MKEPALDFYKTMFEELEPAKMQRQFLRSLLNLQNVERGSLWVKKKGKYVCVEALGPQSEKIKGMVLESGTPSIVSWVIENGKRTIAEPGKDERHFAEAEALVQKKSKLILSFPLVLKSGEVYGAVQIIDTSAEGNRLNLDKDFLALLEGQVAIGSIALSNSLAYDDKLKENVRLKRTLKEIRDETPIIGQSPTFLKSLKVAQDYAKTDFPVLITGESGTGKELIAYEIHRLSQRRDKPFLVQNCSAIPETLLESELFGYKKGAFTGALTDKTGLFESADTGTVFLDEIGDMPMNLQAKILRVIQNNEIKPLGGTVSKRIDVRILSATNKELQHEIAEANFREDLFYRLNVLPLHLPALRKRPEDIPLLLRYFLRREARRLDMPPKKLSAKSLALLSTHPWKGNIREMENLVKFIQTTVDSGVIETGDLPQHFFLDEPVQEKEPVEQQDAANFSGQVREKTLDSYTWEELERTYVMQLLEKFKWNITQSASAAGVNRSTFDSRLKKLGIRKS